MHETHIGPLLPSAGCVPLPLPLPVALPLPLALALYM